MKEKSQEQRVVESVRRTIVEADGPRSPSVGDFVDVSTTYYGIRRGVTGIEPVRMVNGNRVFFADYGAREYSEDLAPAGEHEGRTLWKRVTPVPGVMGPEVAAAVVNKAVDLHDSASAEYRAAFKDAGVRMWPMDWAHPWARSKTKRKELKRRMINQAQHKDLERFLTTIPQVVTRPLTVLDSYPEVKGTAKHRELDAAVDDIYARYAAEWEEFLAQHRA